MYMYAHANPWRNNKMAIWNYKSLPLAIHKRFCLTWFLQLTRTLTNICQLHQLRRPGDVVWDVVWDSD